ncbi:MAG: hypothetical protein WCX71_02180 [Candidatus Buchananbacteria bacterium]
MRKKATHRRLPKTNVAAERWPHNVVASTRRRIADHYAQSAIAWQVWSYPASSAKLLFAIAAGLTRRFALAIKGTRPSWAITRIEHGPKKSKDSSAFFI